MSHCRGGIGRAGTVASRLLLIELGAATPDEALRRVRKARPGAACTLHNGSPGGWTATRKRPRAGTWEQARSDAYLCVCVPKMNCRVVAVDSSGRTVRQAAARRRRGRIEPGVRGERSGSHAPSTAAAPNPTRRINTPRPTPHFPSPRSTRTFGKNRRATVLWGSARRGPGRCSRPSISARRIRQSRATM